MQKPGPTLTGGNLGRLLGGGDIYVETQRMIWGQPGQVECWGREEEEEAVPGRGSNRWQA